jgi:hypothetical protein
VNPSPIAEDDTSEAQHSAKAFGSEVQIEVPIAYAEIQV